VDVLADASVVGHERALALVIVDAHSLSAAAADGEALQQYGAFAGGTAGAVLAVRAGVVSECALVVLELFPGEVAGVRVRDQRGPLLAGQLVRGRRVRP